MNRHWLFFFLVFPHAFSFQWDQRFVIPPERSQFQNTSTHAEVMAFIKAIQAETGIHVTSFAVSKGGLEVPLMVLSNPRISTPEEARLSGKPVIYLQGNIHGGEVEGKEALMQLVRDILLGEKKYLLDKQILLVAPIYNADGNDKMGAGTRPSQEGSPVEAGSRASGEGFDLNRDGIKMEALETKGLFSGVLLRWDPVLFVDMHTTNGTWHGYSLTYAPNYQSCGDPATNHYLMDTMLPAIRQTVQQKYDLYFYLYGGFSVAREGFPPKTWKTYNHHPRYLINYMGLRNRMGILSETFAHDRFYKRIHSAAVFASEIVEYTHRHGDQLKKIAEKADRDVVAYVLKNAGTARKGVRFKMVPLAETFTLRTYRHQAYQEEGTRYFRTGEIVDVPNVKNYNGFEAEVEATLPRGYLLPPDLGAIVAKLEAHGITVRKLDNAVKAKGEAFRIESFEKASYLFEGHHMARAAGAFAAAEQTFPRGSFLVDLAQPLANLIFYLLEPESDDGLVNWNFFDTYLEGKTPVTYPVFKYFEILEGAPE